MSGLLGTKASGLYDINLILQITILVLLIIGRKLAKDKKLLDHGRAMESLLALHTIAILLIMIPSFLINLGALGHISDPRAIITWIHAIFGTSAEALGVFLVSKWRSQPKSVSACAKRRKFMQPTFALWGSQQLLG